MVVVRLSFYKIVLSGEWNLNFPLTAEINIMTPLKAQSFWEVKSSNKTFYMLLHYLKLEARFLCVLLILLNCKSNNT